MAAKKKPQAFTARELKQRHAYLVKCRHEHLASVLALAEARLEADGRNKAAWQVLNVLPDGGGFTYDVPAAAASLGPEYELDPKLKRQGVYAKAQRARERFLDAMRRIEREDGYDQMAAYLHARDRHPELYLKAYGSTPAPVIGADAWLAAQAGSLAAYALALVEIDDMARVDPLVERALKALAGDVHARRQMEQDRAAKSRGGLMTSDRNARKNSPRDLQIRREYHRMKLSNLRQCRTEKDAGARAITALSVKYGRTPKRIREILRGE